MSRPQRSSRPGPRRLPADVVAFEQRERLMAAMATAVSERGYERTTVTDIVTTAAIARPTFYEHFADKESCFLATFDALASHVRKLMEDAFAAEDEWASQVAAALVALVRFLTQHPEAARVCFVDAGAVGPAINERVDEALEWMIALLARQPGDAADENARSLNEAVAVGAMTMLSWRLDPGPPDFPSLAAEVVESVLGPYVGFDEAKVIADRYSVAEI